MALLPARPCTLEPRCHPPWSQPAMPLPRRPALLTLLNSTFGAKVD